MLNVGDHIDRYVVEALIGEGGMARVYRVRHETLEALYALKVLTIHAPGVKERLVAEGKVQSQLNHPNVLRVLDVVDVNGSPGLVMDYVDGPDLDAWLAATKPTLKQALDVFEGVAAGVRAAHSAGLVHRDLKPGNVLIATAPDGTPVPKVSDFGLVKAVAGEDLRRGATRAGMPMGTPSYMPPEQIRDASTVDARADVFALGCILYELVVGERAFDGEDPIDIFDKVRAGDHRPLPPTLPPQVAHTIRRCLATDREQRLASVEEVQKTLHTEPLPEAQAALPPRSPVLVSGVVVLVAGLVVAGVVGAGVFAMLLTAFRTSTCEGPTGGWVRTGGGGLPRDGADWIARDDVAVRDRVDGGSLCTLPAGTTATIAEVAEPVDPRDPWVRLDAEGMVLGGPGARPEGLAVCFGDVQGWAQSRSAFTRPKRGAETWIVRPTQPLLSGRPTEANGWSADHPALCELVNGSEVVLDGDPETVRGSGTWVPVRAVR